METQKWWVIARAPLLHKIVLLQMLREIMEPPSEISISDIVNYSGDKVQRVMSLQREKELAESLAYLASWSDDPAHILAVCTEEGSDKESITISLAVNTGSLEKVTEGFREMARMLERTARNGHATSEDLDGLLREAVSLNRARILCRLRSRHAKYKCNYSVVKKSQPRRLPLILRALKDSAASCGVPSSDFAKLVTGAEILNQLSTELESLTTDEINSESGLRLLVSIVVTCKRLQSRKGLQIALARCSRSMKTSTEVMIGFIARISRYYAASSFLLQAATRFPIFSLIKVSFVTVRAPKVPKMDLDPFVATVVDDLSNRQNSRNPNRVLTKPALKIKEEICLIATAKSYPVHAEIQLLFHYERKFSNHPPRVISSYKKACYLCSLFFGLHGKFIVPSTHGRLYEKWALPEDVEKFQVSPNKHIYNTLQRFVLTIEKAIIAVIASTQHRPIQAPYESVIFLSPVWSSAPSTVVQNIAGDQASVTKEKTAINQSRWDQETSENLIAARPSCMKSVQKAASSVASIIPQAEAELAICNSKEVAEPDSASEIDSSSRKNSIHGHLRGSELHAVAGSNSFLEVNSELKVISSLKSVRDSVINLSSISKSTILSNYTYEAIRCGEPSLEESGVAESTAILTSVYFPLKLGETVSRELSASMRYFKVGTPRLHITLSFDQATRAIEQPRFSSTKHLNVSVNNGKGTIIPLNMRYRVDVKWLYPSEKLKAMSHVPIVVLNSFSQGSQKTLDLQDRGGLKDLWLSRGSDLVSVTYTLLNSKRERVM